jgi:tRNA-guanine transglycosylase
MSAAVSAPAAPRFEVLAQDGAARLARLTLPHGSVDTPAFMPVGTYGTVKAMTPEELEALGVQIVLGNTFHLMLRPGSEIIALHRDGLHGFMGWTGPILTDSGGFQVFSLASLRRIDEDGVSFRSPVDGANVRLRPEDAMDVQRALASDIAMAFDDCTAYPATRQQARESMQRSMRWALRSHDHYYREQPPATLRPEILRAQTLNPVICLASCRAGCSRICGSSRSRRCPSADLPVMRSAGWPWVSRRKSGCACSTS